jgi:hypothetical protein
VNVASRHHASRGTGAHRSAGWPRRTAWVAVPVVAGTAVAAAVLAPALGVLQPDKPLPAAGVQTSAGIPVPAVAQPCPNQALAGPGGERWCLPPDVTAAALEDWYAMTLPPHQDAPGLRWCVQQVQADGSHRSIWSDGSARLGYDLPTRLSGRPGSVAPGEEGLVVEVFRNLDHSCPAAARSSRGKE